MRAVAPILAVALSALSACGSDGDEGAAARVLAGAAGLRAGPGAAGAPAAAAPADLAALPQPVLRVRLAATGAEALVVPVARAGGVTTFASADGRTVSLREGVVVATRGLGPDLMASDGPRLSDLRPGAAWLRRFEWLDGLDRPQGTTFACTTEGTGAELRETCRPEAGGSAGFTNTFRLAPGGRIAESSQWLGPDLGMLTIRSLSGLP